MPSEEPNDDTVFAQASTPRRPLQKAASMMAQPRHSIDGHPDDLLPFADYDEILVTNRGEDADDPRRMIFRYRADRYGFRNPV